MTKATWDIAPSPEQTTQTVADLHDLSRIPFNEVPRTLWRRVYGVPYVQLDDTTGGRLWVTRHGWRHLPHLDPAKWFLDGQYSRRGVRLSGGSGAVYRVSSTASADRSVELIVKFSRMAQDLPVHVSSQFLGDVPRHVADETACNDPFQEFGLLEELRSSRFGSSSLRVRTKRPLAVYSPGKSFELWQLGRTEDRFRRHCHQLAKDQGMLGHGMKTVELSIERQYVYLFHWVRGIDAQSLVQAGAISAQEATALVIDVNKDLAAKGFRMLDNKPSHVILRKRHDGQLLRRGGRLVYALVDFELLQRTEQYRRWRESADAAAITRKYCK